MTSLPESDDSSGISAFVGLFFVLFTVFCLDGAFFDIDRWATVFGVPYETFWALGVIFGCFASFIWLKYMVFPTKKK